MLQLWYKQIKRQESNNPINIYNIERTLCDMIRHYKSMDREIVNKTIIRKYCTENQKREVVCPYDMCKKNRDC